jgi:hypothetical protein
MHVTLLGDSIFDNGSYTNGEPDVVSHLRNLLPAPWKATLVAVDGTTSRGLAAQVPRVPPDAVELVVSVGGNDALHSADLLNHPVSSTMEALLLFGQRAEAFEADYRAALRQVLALGRRTTVCTVYNGNFGAREGQVARVGLMPFNDVILRVALEYRLPVIDLRAVCTQPSDYANPIEPSGSGGRKIALAIAENVGVKTMQSTLVSRQK